MSNISEVNRGYFAHAIGMAYEIAMAEQNFSDADFDSLAKDGGAGGMSVEDFANNLTEDDIREFMKFWGRVTTRDIRPIG